MKKVGGRAGCYSLIQSLQQAGLTIMMGRRQVGQFALFHVFLLETPVPAGHFLRSIDRFVELGGLRQELAAFYGTMSGPLLLQWPTFTGCDFRYTRVKKIQRRLTERGFKTDGIDGRTGSDTVKAIGAFPRGVGMKPDGYAGLKVQARLRQSP